jgi:hypothetical protein
MSSNRIFYPAKVVSNKDRLMLNRVRVEFTTPIDDINNDSLLKGVPKKFKDKNGKLLVSAEWGPHDPFVFLPLLPIFLNTTPKEGEYVNTLWPNHDNKFNEQYYIQGTFSSPWTLYTESYNSSRMTATRDRIKEAKQLRNGINFEYNFQNTEGVFPEPDDTALLGRGTCDIIVKEKHVLLRAGKSEISPKNPNTPVVANPKRSFIQLSDFDERITEIGNKTNYVLKDDIINVKTLIEWDILNPENQFNLFIFTVNFYKLPPKPQYTTRLTIDSKIENADKSLIYSIQFSGLSKDETAFFINTFIEQVNDGELNIPPFDILPNISDQFPCVFRPSEKTYNWLKYIGSSSQAINVGEISSKVFFKTAKNGFGLIFSTNNVGQKKTVEPQTFTDYDHNLTKISYNMSAGDKILLLSHESKIPDRKPIILNKDTMLGIEQNYLVKNILPNTNSLVRGEQLIYLMNLIVRFLIGHVHPLPGMAPNSKSIDGVTIQKLLIELQNAPETILNQNIRIN